MCFYSFKITFLWYVTDEFPFLGWGLFHYNIVRSCNSVQCFRIGTTRNLSYEINFWCFLLAHIGTFNVLYSNIASWFVEFK